MPYFYQQPVEIRIDFMLSDIIYLNYFGKISSYSYFTQGLSERREKYQEKNVFSSLIVSIFYQGENNEF